MAISQVVAMKVDGTLYNTLPPNAVGSGAGGEGGSVAKATGTSLLDGVEVSRYDAGVFGSTVVDTVDIETTGSGTLAHNNASPIAKRLPGSPNDILLSGAGQPHDIQSIHYTRVYETIGDLVGVQGVRTRKLTSAIREGKFNEFTGQFDMGYPVVSVDLFAPDQAAIPTRVNPNRFRYKSSALNPVFTDQPAKTG
jgi:hypothetical protein